MDNALENNLSFIDLFSSSPDGIIITNLDGEILLVNPQAEKMFGYRAEELIRKPVEVLIPQRFTTHPTNREKFAANPQKRIMGEGLDLYGLQQNGTEFSIDISLSFLKTEDSSLISATIRDITERKQVEDEIQKLNEELEDRVNKRTKELQESENRFRSILEDMTELIYRWKPDGTIVFVNEQYAKLFQKTREEFIKINFFSLISSKAAKIIKRRIKTLTPQQPIQTDEYLGTKGDRAGRWYHWTDRGTFDEEGQLIAIQSMGWDITDRKNMEEALKQSEEKYRSVVEDQTEFLVRYLPDTTRTFVNQSYSRHMGRSEDDLIGTRIIDELSKEEQKRFRKKLAKLTPTNPVFTDEFYTISSDDEECWETWTDRGIFNKNGELKEIQAFGQEITQHMLDDREMQLQNAALEASANAIIITDFDGMISWVNPAFSRLTGYMKEEAVGNQPNILKSGQHDEVFYSVLWDTIKSGQVWHNEIINKRKDGSLYTEEITITPVKNQRGEISHFIAVKQDITKRKKNEENLKNQSIAMMNSYNLISSLNQVASKVQTTLDPQQIYKILEYELTQQGINYFVAFLDPEGQDMILKYVAMGSKALKAAEKLAGVSSQGFSIPRKNFPVYEDLVKQKKPQYFKNILPVIEKMLPEFPEVLVKSFARLAGMKQNVSTIYLPLFADEEVIGVLVVWGENIKENDISTFSVFASQVASAIRVSELFKETQVANQAKSEFLSRMSHERRTPMNSILGFAQLMEMSKKDPLSDSQRERTNQVIQGGKHLLSLINEILDLSRIEAGRLEISPEPVQLQSAEREACELIKPLADQKDIQIVIPTEPGENLYILADHQRLKQVCLNLMSNAVKYTRQGGRVTVTHEERPNGYLRILVTDTGNGMSPDQIERIFKPFERLGAETSEVEGVGLGLSISKRLVELMDGKIGVESEVGQGSTFWVELPITNDPLEYLIKKDEEKSLVELPAQIFSILYIEDNPANFELVRQILTEYPQIELLGETRAEIGIEIARQQKPDLIILDMQLPGMNGLDAMRHLKSDKETKAIPVIMHSADANPSKIKELMKLGAEAYLTKPLNIEDFIKLIEKLMKGNVN